MGIINFFKRLFTKEKKEKSQEEEARFLELATKQKALINFKKQNEDLLKQLNNLYQQLNDLTTTHTTDYFDKEKQKQLDLLKINPKLQKQFPDNENSSIFVTERKWKKSNSNMFSIRATICK